jgi:dynein heavy chain 1, cytosolic
VMTATRCQLLQNLFSLLVSSVKAVLMYNSAHPDFPLEKSKLERYISRSFYIQLAWSVSGGLNEDSRKKIGKLIFQSAGALFMVTGNSHPIDFDVELTSGELTLWKSAVPKIEVDANSLSNGDVVIPTIDTLRHEKVLYCWLAERRSILLVGPPGSGKVPRH